jgi:hypothetical protein
MHKRVQVTKKPDILILGPTGTQIFGRQERLVLPTT